MALLHHLIGKRKSFLPWNKDQQISCNCSQTTVQFPGCCTKRKQGRGTDSANLKTWWYSLHTLLSYCETQIHQMSHTTSPSQSPCNTWEKIKGRLERLPLEKASSCGARVGPWCCIAITGLKLWYIESWRISRKARLLRKQTAQCYQINWT